MSIREEARRGFQQGAAAYERGRPVYPREAIAWLSEQLRLGPERVVVDVGAGTGKLTRELVGSGGSVLAVEPVAGMRAVLERVVPEARVLDGTAEALPLGEQAADAVVAASAFHWFDGPRAVAEFHRVLRPAGRLALIWNRRVRDQPLQRALSEITEPHRGGTPSAYRGEWRAALRADGSFRPVAELHVPFEQVLDADGVVDRVASISFIAALADAERDRVLTRVRALAGDAGDPIRLAYQSEAYVYERR